MSKKQPRNLNGRQWVLVLILGVSSVVFGFTVAVIDGLNLQSNMCIIIPVFFAGWGIGYLFCFETIRNLEKKH